MMYNKNVTNSEEEAKEYMSRYKLLYFCLIAVSVLVTTRLFYLQIIQGEILRTYSDKNRVKETNIPAPRGLILDRNMEVLVDNLPGFEAVIIPQQVENLEKSAKAVAEVLNLNPKQLIKHVNTSKRQNGMFRPVKIKENLTLDEVMRVKMLRLNHPGVNINATILRSYTMQKNGAQLFGYVGEISKRQIEDYNEKFKGEMTFVLGDIVGKNGLEEIWEKNIRGKDGISFIEVDARGREKKEKSQAESLLGFKPIDAKPGQNLVLTIDKDIQQAAYEAMQREDKIGPRIGALVAIKNNGEVLAWVNSPSYDPNEFSTGISSSLWKDLIENPYKPLRNKVIQDHYAPGSTFKPIVALAALQEDVIEPSTVIYAPGRLRYGNRVYHDHNRYGHGNITVTKAIEKSSNVFFYKMGIQLGIDTMYKYAKMLGIGEKTNINLANEQSGLMPNSEWKKKQYGEEWQPGENLSNAIGQGFVLTTPLQMAVAFNAIGTEGKVYKPFVVKKVIDSQNNIVKEFKPELKRDVSEPNENGDFISNKTFKVVKEGMRLVANGDQGTARWWKIPGVQMAGKTGTVQIQSFSADQIYKKCEERPFDIRHHGWYIGYAPHDNPLITVAVLAEHACHGSTGGAPIARDVIYAYLNKYHPELLQKNKKTPPKKIVQESDPDEVEE